MKEQVQFYDFSWRGSPPRPALFHVLQRHVARHFFLKYLAFLILVLSSLNLQAQDLGLDWAKAFQGSTAVFNATSIEKDASGNVYVGGFFDGTMDFDPGVGVFNMTGVAGNANPFVVKLDAFGNFIWAKSIAANVAYGSQYNHSLQVDAAGNVYLAGSFGGTVDFDTGPGIYNLSSSSGTLPDVYFLKLDTNGNFVFAQRMGNPVNGDHSWDMSIDPAGNIYLGGHFFGTQASTFGPFTLTGTGFDDIFVTKIDPTGTFLWAQRIGSTSRDYLNAIETDASGNVYLGLRISGATTGIANLPGAGATVIKLNSAGNLQWFYQHSAWTSIGGLAIDSGENVFASQLDGGSSV